MVILALIYVAFISLGLPDSLLGSSWPMMHLEFAVPVGSAGMVSMIISGGTIISSLLSHRVIERFGTARVTAASAAMTAAALVGFAVSPGFTWLLFFAIPLGLGAGAVDAGLNEFVAEHYAAQHMNWLHCFWGVGAMLGPLLISLSTRTGGSWRSGYLNISLVQWVLVVLLLSALRRWTAMEKSRSVQQCDAQKSKKHGLLAPLKAPGALWAMLTFFFYTSVEASVMLWGASYLVHTKAMPPASAAGWVSLFFLGLTGGRLLSGFASLKLSSEDLIRAGTLLVLTGLTIMILPVPDLVVAPALVLVGIGLAPIFPSMLHLTPVYFHPEIAQAAMGMQMAFAYTGTTLMPPLFGQLFARISFSLMPYVLLGCAAGVYLCTTLLAAARTRLNLTSRHVS